MTKAIVILLSAVFIALSLLWVDAQAHKAAAHRAAAIEELTR